jgi:hypothetical protein
MLIKEKIMGRKQKLLELLFYTLKEFIIENGNYNFKINNYIISQAFSYSHFTQIFVGNSTLIDTHLASFLLAKACFNLVLLWH